MAESFLQRQTFQVGHKIFDEDQTGNQAYIVQSGLVEIVKESEGRETVLGTIGQGGMFGEMALIDDQPRMAMARAAEMTTVIVVSRMMFEQKMTKVDPFIRGLLKILVGNIRSLSAELERKAPGVGELAEAETVADADPPRSNGQEVADSDS